MLKQESGITHLLKSDFQALHKFQFSVFTKMEKKNTTLFKTKPHSSVQMESLRLKRYLQLFLYVVLCTKSENITSNWNYFVQYFCLFRRLSVLPAESLTNFHQLFASWLFSRVDFSKINGNTAAIQLRSSILKDEEKCWFKPKSRTTFFFVKSNVLS